VCYYVCAAFRGSVTARDSSDGLDYVCFSLAETGGLNCRSLEPRMIQKFLRWSVLSAAEATASAKRLVTAKLNLRHILALIERDPATPTTQERTVTR